MDKRERFDGATAESLIKWDNFHVVKETVTDLTNWNLDLTDEELKNVIFEACSMYVLKVTKTKTPRRYIEVAGIVDTHDDTIPPFVCIFQIHKKEPVLIKRTSDYKDRFQEVADFLIEAKGKYTDKKDQKDIDAIIKGVKNEMAKEGIDGYFD